MKAIYKELEVGMKFPLRMFNSILKMIRIKRMEVLKTIIKILIIIIW